MQSIEKGKHKGGILADDMGLGKTVSTIALTCVNPPTEKRCPTLIIAPLSLATQWKNEIESKTTRHKFKIKVHHGMGRSKTSSDLKQYDFVITTSGVLCSEAPEDQFDVDRRERKKRKERRAAEAVPGTSAISQILEDGAENDESSDDSFLNSKVSKSHPLFEVNWHRVIIDEGTEGFLSLRKFSLTSFFSANHS